MSASDQALPRNLDLWPEEFLGGWNPEASRFFLPTLATQELGTLVAVRITIRGTGIAATVTGRVVGSRRAGSGVEAGVYLGLEGRGRSAAGYLGRVARNQPVEFNERLPRYAASWTVLIGHGGGRFQATTLNVSEEGCQVTWPGGALPPGAEVRLRPGSSLLGGDLAADVRWSIAQGGGPCTAGLHFEPLGRAGKRWRSAVHRVAESGAARV